MSVVNSERGGKKLLKVNVSSKKLSKIDLGVEVGG